MRIELAPVQRFDQVESAAIVLELLALISGVASVDDTDLDLEALLSEVIQNLSEFDLDGEGEFLSEEKFAGEVLAKEKFCHRLNEALNSRAKAMGSSYPYSISYSDGPIVTRKPSQEINSSGLSWVLLSVFHMLEDRDLSQISKTDRSSFTKHFEAIFELISAIALAGDCEGIVWWNGASRSKKTFLRQLRKIQRFIGSGAVKTEDLLEENQTGVNDAGVDVFSIHTYDGKVTTASRISLLGATLQATSRRGKIVTTDSLNRLRGFFSSLPTVAFEGILSIPFEQSLAEAQTCRDSNCRYFHRDVLIQHLSLRGSRVHHVTATPYVNRLEQRLLLKVNKLVDQLTFCVGGAEHKFPLTV